MPLPPEVLSSIIEVAGDWALALASSPTAEGNPIEPSGMSSDLEMWFHSTFAYLSDYVTDYLAATD